MVMESVAAMPAVSTAVELIPLPQALDAMRRYLGDIRREKAILAEREMNLAAAIEHIERANGAPSMPLTVVSDAPITDSRVVEILQKAGRPMTIEEIARACQPHGLPAKTYKAVRRVIVQESGGQPSLIDRGLVTIDKRIRPLTAALTAKGVAQAQSEASKA